MEIERREKEEGNLGKTMLEKLAQSPTSCGKTDSGNHKRAEAASF